MMALVRGVMADSVILTVGLLEGSMIDEAANIIRKGGAIVVYDYEGNPVKRYNLTAAWPKSLEISSMKAGDTSVMTEKLVITYEKCEPA